MVITIARDGQEIGAWTDEEVRLFYRMGRLVDTDQYWTDGMTEWLPLMTLVNPPPHVHRYPSISSAHSRSYLGGCARSEEIFPVAAASQGLRYPGSSVDGVWLRRCLRRRNSWSTRP